MAADGLPFDQIALTLGSSSVQKERPNILRRLHAWVPQSWSTQLAPTPTDRYCAARYRRQPVRSPDAITIARYERELEALAEALPYERVNWYLEGGMALAAHVGGFLRTHSDVDIGVFRDDIYDLEDCLRRRNYRLFSRNPHTHAFEYAKFDVVRATDGDEISTKNRVKRLTAIKVDGRGRVDWDAAILPRFDIHVHRRGEGVVYLTNRRFEFPSDLFFQNATHETANCQPIQLASIPFIYFFKLQGRRPKQVFDRELIEERGLLSEDDASRVRAALVD